MVVSAAILGIILLGVIYLATHPIYGINAQLDARRAEDGVDDDHDRRWAMPEMYSPRVRPAQEPLPKAPRGYREPAQALTEDSPEWAAYSKTLGL